MCHGKLGNVVFILTVFHHCDVVCIWRHKKLQNHVNRDRGPDCSGTPPTPPYMRVRIRRLSTSFKSSRYRQDSSHWIGESAGIDGPPFGGVASDDASI